MSPRWTTVGPYGLYFYSAERHRRPHVNVRGGGYDATMDLSTGEVLGGRLPPRDVRRVQRLLAAHSDLAAEAFWAAYERRAFATLEERLSEEKRDG